MGPIGPVDAVAHAMLEAPVKALPAARPAEAPTDPVPASVADSPVISSAVLVLEMLMRLEVQLRSALG